MKKKMILSNICAVIVMMYATHVLSMERPPTPPPLPPVDDHKKPKETWREKLVRENKDKKKKEDLLPEGEEKPRKTASQVGGVGMGGNLMEELKGKLGKNKAFTDPIGKKNGDEKDEKTYNFQGFLKKTDNKFLPKQEESTVNFGKPSEIKKQHGKINTIDKKPEPKEKPKEVIKKGDITQDVEKKVPQRKKRVLKRVPRKKPETKEDEKLN